MSRNNNVRVPHQRRHRFSATGFTLIELMIVCAIIAILASIAYPAYTSYIVRTHRVAAEGCLSEYANYMERYYTTYLRYDKDPNAGGAANTLPDLDCKHQTSENYSYEFKGGSLTATAYTIDAIPRNAQASRDTKCGTLSLDQTGKRTDSGSGSLDDCW